MKTALVLATLVALALSGAVPTVKREYKTKSVDAEFVAKQKKVLSLFYHPSQIDVESEYYKIGIEYSIEQNIDCYTNKKAVEEFLTLYKVGLLPKGKLFSIFYEKMREEAIALFHLFFYAKDFDTFYKTAAFARVYLNQGQFLYAYYIAVIHRPDTVGIVVPAPYEVYPQFFVNAPMWYRISGVKIQNNDIHTDAVSQFGVVQEENKYVFYANYSNSLTYPYDEHRLSYFTEDIGLNSYYYYFHTYFPFWMDGDLYPIMKERRGEIYFYFYQQLLARYYLERLVHGLGEIPEFSWKWPIKTGYYPFLYDHYPFAQRPSYYQVPHEKHVGDLQFLDSYEKTFIQLLEQGHFKAYNQDVDLRNSKSINFVGNFWQANHDLFVKLGARRYHNSYEMTARRVLAASPEPVDKYTFVPSALDFYQTSLRDPVFYQLYYKIFKYFVNYKEYLQPYTQDTLHYVGVKINDVKVDKLVTFFDYYDFDVSNGVIVKRDEFKKPEPWYKVRQPRLDHKPFTVTVDVKSDVEGEAAFKIFLGPKYDENGYPISLDENWKNFVELDWFVQTLTKGQNKIERSSTDFFFYKEDSMPTNEIWKLLEESKVPADMSVESGAMPKRLMLPKGTKGGFPFQIFVVAYPYSPLTTKWESIRAFVPDSKPLGYPFDRPVHEAYFKQPNMYFEDVLVYHEGEDYTYKYTVPWYTTHYNEVTKH